MIIRQGFRHYGTTKGISTYLTAIYTSLVKKSDGTCGIKVWYTDDPYIKDSKYNPIDNVISTLGLPMPEIKNYNKIS